MIVPVPGFQEKHITRNIIIRNNESRTMVRAFMNNSGFNRENTKSSDTGTRTLVSCVKGKYANHLHHIGNYCAHMWVFNIYIPTCFHQSYLVIFSGKSILKRITDLTLFVLMDDRCNDYHKRVSTNALSFTTMIFTCNDALI